LCKLEVAWGYESERYSFPRGHPLNNTRTELFVHSLRKLGAERPKNLKLVKPVPANDEELLLFHTREYVEFVKEKSRIGEGYLDYGDTPAFPGVYEASLYTVGTTLYGMKQVMEGKTDHFFNPIGGLHHARRERAGGFCVFDDAAVAISRAVNELGMKRVAYVDIDAHHGDGVFYGFERDERVIIGDIHEDGRFLYPGTGFATETGKEKAVGTKLNIPLAPGAGDDKFIEAFDRIEKFIRASKPEFIFFQCGADGLHGDPITQLEYSARAHSFASRKLHEISHELCEGRILAMGGGGYNPKNVDSAWIAVAEELSGEASRST
jgi:acetoin utilization protein AcuC